MLLTATAHSQPQRPTIPELVARGSSGSTTTAPSGKAPAIGDVLANADVVVRGTVGQPESYLSDDKRDVYTDYQLLNPVVLYQSEVKASPRPGSDMWKVTQLGGTVAIANLEFTQKELGLPALTPGMEALFILKRVDDKYHIARTFYGAFAIAGGKVRPLTPKADYAPEYRDAPVSEVLEDMATRLRVLHP